VPVSDPEEYERAEWENEETVEECGVMLPAVADAEAVRTWWGVRPLYAPGEAGSDRPNHLRPAQLTAPGRRSTASLGVA
jgi:glycerol-3-phosphate dehydrogenase